MPERKYNPQDELDYQEAYAKSKKRKITRKADKAVSEKGIYTYSPEESQKRAAYDRVIEGYHDPSNKKKRASASKASPKKSSSGFASLLEGLGLIRDRARKTKEGFDTLNKMGQQR